MDLGYLYGRGWFVQGLRKDKSLAFNNPAAMHQLLDKLADAVAVYLTTQVEQGAQALQIFDTWGGSLSHSDYQEFSLRYMQAVVERLPREADGRRVPVIVFTKGGGQWLEQIADCGADAVGLDWTTDIGLLAHGWVIRSRCRAIWIQPCSTRSLSGFVKRSGRFWKAMALELAIF